MTKKIDTFSGQPGLPDLIRNTYREAAAPGPAQQEAIDLLESFGFDPKMSAEQLTDAFIFAVLQRPHSALLH